MKHAGDGLTECRSLRLAWRDTAVRTAGLPDRERHGRRRAVRTSAVQTIRARAKLVVMLVMSVAMLSAACGTGNREDAGSGGAHPATSTTRMLEGVPAPDPVTPDGVAVTALREIYTWQPATEAQGASLARARKWLGPSLIRVLDSTPTGLETPKTTLQWSDWATAKARVEAFTFASGERPPNDGDPNVQQFKIGIEQTVVYPNGRKEQLPPATVIATVVQTPDGWRLDAFR
ncbi:hypothetical protein F5X71_23355 [Nocardia brasiliensis]|uniref:Uncharacterized protein n=1 Tax=Nocardia brasiliensis TaxID=37326 RepID=A0A6G9XVL0_NOCBR|nr:hypothetical protein F5X71_23355 [Nocardia brasiliensis]